MKALFRIVTLISIAACIWLIKDLTSIVKQNTKDIEWLVNFHIKEIQRKGEEEILIHFPELKNKEKEDGN